MKKILVLIIGLFCLTGCEAIYTLSIIDGDYIETLEVNNYQVSSWGNGEGSYREAIGINAKAAVPTDLRRTENVESNERYPGINYYQISLVNRADNLGVRYENTFTLAEYAYSRIAGIHFTEFKVTNFSGEVNINTGTEPTRSFVAYPSLQKLTIQVKTNHYVVGHNADEVKGDTYFWYLTKHSTANKNPMLKIKEVATSDPNLWQLDQDGYFGIKTLIAIYSFLVVIAIGGGIYIYFKIKRSNR